MSKNWSGEGQGETRPPLLREMPPLLPEWVYAVGRWGWAALTRSRLPARHAGDQSSSGGKGAAAGDRLAGPSRRGRAGAISAEGSGAVAGRVGVAG